MAGGVPLDPYAGAPLFFPPLGPATMQGPSAPSGWDRCVLADQVLPGKARITRAACKLKIDHKSKGGADGSNPTYRGLEPQPIELEILTYNDADREQLALIVGPFVPQPGQVPKTVAIDHPSLRILRISAVQVVGAGPIMPELGTTKARMTLDLMHAMPAKKKNVTTTPKGAPVRKVKNVGPTSNPLPTQQPGFAAPPQSLQSGG